MSRKLIQERLAADASGMREVNMTPLIDISLVIVTMLILTTPLSFESSIALRQSSPRAPDPEEGQVTERLELHLVSEETLELNGMLVKLDSLEESLRPAVESSATKQVIVTCEDAVSHGTFVRVIDLAKMCGAEEIGVMEK
jgi:biopolymer transport protein ExbD